ncbi:glycoprotein-n-acetylgalactosamine 3-beta-galactosyltransferase 1 [Plakobranchus ocellatus]|uniref:N-acetylgalactosaminide beta-1,3-galactosyltransferase n=1 Tax=Plakobranchus ocellatus TaxID=259542 RepID=A0AAV4ARF7_9GAST|nr:glycoprotein-n-acetylgalactosamine 3-beta-galactosyltransferase 1 [Plakobranchus ocellatus]
MVDLENNINFRTFQPLDQPRQKSDLRIFCWALMRLETLPTKGRALQNTWTKRCDKVIFFSSKLGDTKVSWQHPYTSLNSSGNLTIPHNSNYDKNWRELLGPGAGTQLVIPTITLDVPEGREHLTAKAMLASVYSWRVHGQKFDWFLKSDDDTYVVMDNLRDMLQSYNPDMPVYFGYRFKPYTPQGYMSGGAGYVLSREALRRLVVDGILGKFCGPFTGVEDLDIGQCLYTVGVKALDSVDDLGLERFHPLNFFAYFGNTILPTWTGDYAFHPFKRVSVHIFEDVR